MVCIKLSALTTEVHACTIKVKVIRLWESINNKTDDLMSLDMILMDEKEDVMHASIWKSLIDTYKPHIKESCVYSITNFKVQQATIYRPINNDLKIVFAYNTNLKEMKTSLNIHPKYYFDFATREIWLERENKDTHCSDVIGLLTSVSTLQKITIMKHSRNPRIKDIREIEILLFGGEKAKLTLWGDLAHFLSEDVIGKQTVIIITSIMIQSPRFKVISLKTTSATRIYINLDIPETHEVIERHSEEEENIPKLIEISKGTQETLEQQMFHNRRTLREITEIRKDSIQDNDFVFTSKATIDQLQSNTKWWYMSCSSCNKMCTKNDDKYFCPNCSDSPKRTTPRYWLRFDISDHTTSTTCTIFDEEAKKIVGTSISELLDSLEGNTEDVPKPIQNLYGKEIIFRFKLNDSNLMEGRHGYLVKRTYIPDDNLERKLNNFDGTKLIEYDSNHKTVQQESDIKDYKDKNQIVRRIEQEKKRLIRQCSQNERTENIEGTSKSEHKLENSENQEIPTDELDNEYTEEENILSPGDEHIKLKRRRKAIIIDSETEEDNNEQETTKDTIGDESSDDEFVKKKDRIEKSIALGTRMARLMNDLGLNISSGQVKEEDVEDHNNCGSKSKKSFKLTKSVNMKNKREVADMKADTKDDTKRRKKGTSKEKNKQADYQSKKRKFKATFNGMDTREDRVRDEKSKAKNQTTQNEQYQNTNPGKQVDTEILATAISNEKNKQKDQK